MAHMVTAKMTTIGAAPDRAFWNGRRVFMTGHTGFKGSWLSLMLRKLGANAVGFARNPPTEPSLFELAHVADAIEDHRGELMDRAALTACLAASKAEIVIHMAAQPLVRASYADPVENYASNVMGTVHLLDAVRQVPGVKAVVVITTDKCYENKEWLWAYRETDRLGGHDPYSNSKACAELVTQSFRDSFFPIDRFHDHGVAIATTRAGNCIGGGDWAADRLIPDAVRAKAAGQKLEIRYPDAIRPWQHLMDPLLGYLLLAENLVRHGVDFADSWNFGPDAASERKVVDVLSALDRRWSDGLAWNRADGNHPHEATFLKLDTARARARLGWAPRLDFDAAMATTADWYEKYRCGENPRTITDQQIAAYLSV